MKIAHIRKEKWLDVLQRYQDRSKGKISKFGKLFEYKIRRAIQIPKGTGREISSAFFQLKLGHGYNKSYLHRFGLSPDDKCECGKRETPEHLLLECKKFGKERIRLKESLNGNRLTMRLLDTKVGI